MKKITLALFLFSCLPSFSQVTLIDPAGDGGFETGTTFEENGWSVANPAGANRKWYLGTGQEGYNGERAAFIGNNPTTVGSGSQNRKVHLYRSISIPAGAENITLTFNYKQETSDVFAGEAYDYIAVYTSANAPVNNALPAGGELQFGPYPEVDGTGFAEQAVMLPNDLAGTTTNLIFSFVADNIEPDGYGAIDDISLTYIMPACSAPGNFTAVNTTVDSTDLSWTASVSNPSGGYQYYYTDTDSMPDASTAPLGTSSGTGSNVPGLSGSTAYRFWIRSDCGGGTYSSWSGPLSISTLCDAFDPPFLMGFEDTDDLECLQIQNINGGTSWSLYANGGNGAATGISSVRYRKSANKPGDDWIFLKGLTLSGGESYMLSFKYKSSAGPDLTENLEVKYGAYPNAAAMTSVPIVTLEGINSDITDPFLEASTIVVPDADGVYYFGFHCYSQAAQGVLYIDDVLLDVHLSTNEYNAKIQSFPNPVAGVLHLSSSESIFRIEVYNLLGQKVLEKPSTGLQAEIDMSGLPSGNYLVKAASAGFVQTLKIIKQ